MYLGYRLRPVQYAVRYLPKDLVSVDNRRKSDRRLGSHSNPGKFNRSELSTVLDSLKELYGKLGFIYSTVTPDIRFKEVPGDCLLDNRG